jgi:hypothetical protein
MAHTTVSLMERDVQEILVRYWAEGHGILQYVNAAFDEDKSQWVITHPSPIKK